MSNAAITKAIYDKLIADANVTGKISTFASIPAVFSGSLVPRRATLPYVLISGPIGFIVRDDKNGETKEHIRDIRGYVSSDKSTLVLEQLMDALHDSLHNQTITVAGHNVILIEVIGYSSGVREDDTTGYILTVRIITDK